MVGSRSAVLGTLGSQRQFAQKEQGVAVLKYVATAEVSRCEHLFKAWRCVTPNANFENNAKVTLTG